MKRPEIDQIKEDIKNDNFCVNDAFELFDYIEELEKEKGKLKETIYQLTGSKHYIF